MSELSEYYRNLKDNPPPKPVKKVHKGNWSLVYFIGSKRFIAVENKSYAIIVRERSRLQKETQYKNAVFQIVPYEKK